MQLGFLPASVAELGRQTAHGSWMGAVWFSPVLLPGMEGTHGSPMGCLHPSGVGAVTLRAPLGGDGLLVGLLGLVSGQAGRKSGGHPPGLAWGNSETGTVLQSDVRAGTRSPHPKVGDEGSGPESHSWPLKESSQSAHAGLLVMHPAWAGGAEEGSMSSS